MDKSEPRELCDPLSNEPQRAYRAFEPYLLLPSADRTLLAAYRSHVGNTHAPKPSDTWSQWSCHFAWRERAAAYDAHMAALRRGAYERGVEGEAESQGALAERNRNRMNEVMTRGYERAMEWLENAQISGFRAQDVINIVRLHMDVAKAFDTDRKPEAGLGWTEEDDAELDDILKDLEAQNLSVEDSDEGYTERNLVRSRTPAFSLYPHHSGLE
jgi:hypothetical protein